MNSARDADSTVASVAVTFDPFALIKGNLTLGYRDFRPRSAAIPPYTGGTVQADLSYTAFGSTRASVTVARDVQYSFELAEPYYIQTGATFSISEHIAGPIDAVARVGLQHLAYQKSTLAPQGLPDRTDRVRSSGAGLGYRIEPDLRLGVNVDAYERTSPIGDRRFHALRIGAAMTYGLAP